MTKRNQIITALIEFFQKKPDGPGSPAQPPEVSGDAAQPSGSELLATLEIIADRWHCPRAGHQDLRTWLWNLQVTLSEVDLAAEEDLHAILQIEKQLQQLRME